MRTQTSGEESVQPIRRPLDPVDIAESYLNLHNNDVVAATNAMTDAVMNDMALYRTIMDPLVRMACYNYMTGICRKERKRIWDPPQPSPASESKKVVHLGEGIGSAYMLFPLPGGKLLKDARVDDIDKASTFFLGQGRDMVIKGNWLRLIQSKLPKNKKVSEVMTEEALAKLRSKAEKEA